MESNYLENYIIKRKKEKSLLLMTHIVSGYPSVEESYRIIQAMVKGGVDLIELQLPFSEPIADGPVIVEANQQVLEHGVTIRECMELAGRCAAEFNIPFLYMTYYNIPFKMGIKEFVRRCGEQKIRGLIIPDLPLEEGEEYYACCREGGIAPVLICTPRTGADRMRAISSRAGGFVYCAAREGVSGLDTSLSPALEAYLTRCRREVSLPVALGFGIKGRRELAFLEGKADIGVMGTRVMEVYHSRGIEGLTDFLETLRSSQERE